MGRSHLGRHPSVSCPPPIGLPSYLCHKRGTLHTRRRYCTDEQRSSIISGLIALEALTERKALVGQVRPLWGAEPRGIGCRTDRHAPAGAPRGQHVHTPLPATLYPHRQAKPTPQSSASGRDTWPNEASERWVHAPTPCASPRSVSLATTWGFARRGPGGEDADGGTREINGCTHHAAATDRPILALAMRSLPCLGDGCTYRVLTRCGTAYRAPQMA